MERIKKEFVGCNITVGKTRVTVVDDESQYPRYKALGLDFIFEKYVAKSRGKKMKFPKVEREDKTESSDND